MFQTSPARPRAFTLVELLVVIGIIALLISILLPALSQARHSAYSTLNLSNLRQLGIGLEFYRNDYEGKFPRHSSLTSETTSANPPSPRTRWADDIFPYIDNERVFESPLLDDSIRLKAMKPWAHTCDPVTGQPYAWTRYYGGYGYNYQYLGNARIKPGNAGGYYASTAAIRDSARTIALADTKGSRNGDAYFDYDEGTYSIDPPLQSLEYGSRGSRQTTSDPYQSGNYGYTGGNGTLGTIIEEHRATPDARNRGGRVAVVFVDGHGAFLLPREMDDSDNNGKPDNGLWSGLGDPDAKVR